MVALVLFVLGSLLCCAASWNDASLIAFRVLQGFAAGLIFTLIQTLAVRAAGGHPGSNLIAAVSLPVALGPILGPAIGGLILNWLSWRWVFLVNVRDRRRATARVAVLAPRPARSCQRPRTA